MHNSTNDISDEVVKNLNGLATYHQIRKFGEAFNSLSHYHKQCYFHIITLKGHASAMSSILNVIKKDEATYIFNYLLQKNKNFAFNTLDVITPQFTLFKTLFGALNQYESEYIQHVKAKSRGSNAMFSILNAIEKDQVVSAFYDLFKKDQGFAFNTLDAIIP